MGRTPSKVCVYFRRSKLSALEKLGGIYRSALKEENTKLADMFERERTKCTHAEQTAAVLAAQKADAENRAEEAKRREEKCNTLLLQSQEKIEQLSRELTAELRGKMKTPSTGNPAPATKKPRPSRAKPKAAPSPASV